MTTGIPQGLDPRPVAPVHQDGGGVVNSIFVELGLPTDSDSYRRAFTVIEYLRR